MTALWIALAAILVLNILVALILLLGNAKIHITCIQKPKVIASVLGIRFTLVSDKEPKKAEKDLSRCRNPERALKKELRRQRKEAKKAEKKRKKAAEKAAIKAQKKKQKKALAATQPTPNLKENLTMITELVKKLYTVTRGKIKIHVKKMDISVATEDAAKTAILYGVILQSASYLLQWIDQHFTHIRREAGDMQIRANYLETKTRAEIDIICSIRLFRVLGIGLKMLSSYRKEKNIAMKKAKKRFEKKQISQK